MGWWVEHVVPRLTDAGLSAPEIGELRAQACEGLTGRVLEVGFGSGMNLPHLPRDVTDVAAVEPSDLGWSRSAGRREKSSVPVERVGLDGQSIDLPDASVDAALVTFSLCTIPDPLRALREVRRVVRPGGRLHFLEHGLAPDAGVARWQGRLNGVQGLVCGGCHLDRDIPALVGDAGFGIAVLDQRYLPGPRIGRPWTYGFRGIAE
ncbi:class I SAM-dependent methyltransferase [Nocardioides sp. Root151]|uniref:class I SAM-dependent methyltransferase n=1 Tax=Nocardioides sp. Root151 TaxID=1736475 RepID=UPI0007037620|nr:class I SAM-dependent methyltransferase [Nocardioides sp. Root151]KQZ70401.1 methyltransferase type 11 [Nocardioides sp. Root151]